MNKYRTHKCDELRMENVGEKVKIAGWVQTIRNLGGLIFADIRDQYGITQAVITVGEKLAESFSKIPVESTVSIEGMVRERSSKNKNIPTGDIEVTVENFEILGKRSVNLPFEINDEREVREDLRFEKWKM